MGALEDAVERSEAEEKTSRRRKLAVGATLVLVALVIGAGLLRDDDDGGDGDIGDRTTEERSNPGAGFRYEAELRVPVGERAVVVNADDVPHTYTSDDGLFDTGVLDAGDDAHVPSLAAGTYPYHCEIHPSLRGQLVVTD